MGAGLGLMLKSAGQAFDLLLMIGAGTGLIYILRWFWWRINAYTEIVAMISSLLVAGYFNFGDSNANLSSLFDSFKKFNYTNEPTEYFHQAYPKLKNYKNIKLLNNF